MLGEGLPAWLGYPEPSLDSTPVWVIAVAVTTALLIFAAPLVVTARLSRRAVADGGAQGQLLLIVAAVAVGGFAVMNLLGGLAQPLR